MNEKDFIKLGFIYECIEEIERSSDSTYEVLSNGSYKNDIKYQLALSFLNMAELNFLNFRVATDDIGLGHSEIVEVIESYNLFKNELNTYILDKDTNPSWLGSRNSQLTKNCRVAKDFIKEIIKNYQDSRS